MPAGLVVFNGTFRRNVGIIAHVQLALHIGDGLAIHETQAHSQAHAAAVAAAAGAHGQATISLGGNVHIMGRRQHGLVIHGDAHIVGQIPHAEVDGGAQIIIH